MSDHFARACDYLKRGQFLQAEALLLELVREDANHFDANHMLGIVCCELQKFDKAEAYFLKALSIDAKYPPLFQNYGLFFSKTKRFEKAIIQFNAALQLFPNFAPVYSDRGAALKELKKYDQAIADFNRAILLAPNVPGFYHNRANALYKQKLFTEALRDYDHAISLDPQYADPFCGRGNVLADIKRFDEALAAFDKALTLKPDLAEAWLGRGNIFIPLERHDEACAAYDRALALKPDLGEAWLGRGNVFTALKRHDEALAAYDKALALKPDLSEAWLNRGILKVSRGDVDDGRKDCEQAISLGVDIEVAHFHLARYAAAANIHAVPRKVVEDLFNVFAGYFDSVLVDRLKYNTPTALYNLISQHIEIQDLDILDLGCGTGLLGTRLRPIARTLVGVDLSDRMLDKAKARAIYDDLQCEDIIDFMNNDFRGYDLVASSDVFVYLGDLSGIFDAVKRRLKAAGWFAFSVEATNEKHFVLRETGRFQHSKAYLERLALSHGFKIHAIEDSTLREERKKAVPGFLVLLSTSQ
jgi:predicted TPR repeat methyltransferase